MSVNVQNLIVALTTGLQDVENAFWQLLVERTIDDAIGTHLALLGRIVGQPNVAGADDDTYRRYIRARIATNKSKGTREDLITVARLVLDDAAVRVAISREGPGTLRMLLADTAVDDDIAALVLSFCTASTADGVRFLVEYSSEVPANLFRFDSGLGFDQGVLARAIEG